MGRREVIRCRTAPSRCRKAPSRSSCASSSCRSHPSSCSPVLPRYSTSSASAFVRPRSSTTCDSTTFAIRMEAAPPELDCRCTGSVRSSVTGNLRRQRAMRTWLRIRSYASERVGARLASSNPSRDRKRCMAALCVSEFRVESRRASPRSAHLSLIETDYARPGLTLRRGSSAADVPSTLGLAAPLHLPDLHGLPAR